MERDVSKLICCAFTSGLQLRHQLQRPHHCCVSAHDMAMSEVDETVFSPGSEESPDGAQLDLLAPQSLCSACLRRRILAGTPF